MSAAPITFDDLMAEYERLGVATRGAMADGHTAAELAKAWGLCIDRVHSVLKTAQSKGLLQVSRRESTDLAGRRCSVPCYRIVLKANGKSRRPTKRRVPAGNVR